MSSKHEPKFVSEGVMACGGRLRGCNGCMFYRNNGDHFCQAEGKYRFAEHCCYIRRPLEEFAPEEIARALILGEDDGRI